MIEYNSIEVELTFNTFFLLSLLDFVLHLFCFIFLVCIDLNMSKICTLVLMLIIPSPQNCASFTFTTLN